MTQNLNLGNTVVWVYWWLSPVESVCPKGLVAVFVCSLGEYYSKPRQGTRAVHLYNGRVQSKCKLSDNYKNPMAHQLIWLPAIPKKNQ